MTAADAPAPGGGDGPAADDRQLRQLVAGLAEGVILLDPDGAIAWANRAALAMHGVGRLEDLGATAAEYRARFPLLRQPVAGPHRRPDGRHPMERVLAGETFDGVVVRVAPAGEAAPRWTHRVRGLLLVAGEAGGPARPALLLEDQTARFAAEERFERAFAADPAPAVVLRLSDLRYVKVNRGFLAMTGHPEEAVLGRSAQELDVLEGAKRRALALARLREHRAIPPMEAWPRRPDGSPRLVMVAGQPIELGGAACMLFTFADLDARRRAESDLRQSERRFEAAFRLAPVPMAVASLADWFRFTLVNDAFAEATGHPARDAVGRTAAELGLWDDPGAATELERRLREAGSARGVPLRLRARDGAALDCLLSAEAVTIEGERCALWAIQDVTAHRRTEAELAAAIEAVMRDTSWFTRTVLEKLARLRSPPLGEAAGEGDPAGGGVAGLPRRGREVLELVSRGLDDGAIAARLGLSPTTVRNHVNGLYRRTGARGRAALVVWARERGFGAAEPGGDARGAERRRAGGRAAPTAAAPGDPERR